MSQAPPSHVIGSVRERLIQRQRNKRELVAFRCRRWCGQAVRELRSHLTTGTRCSKGSRCLDKIGLRPSCSRECLAFHPKQALGRRARGAKGSDAWEEESTLPAMVGEKEEAFVLSRGQWQKVPHFRRTRPSPKLLDPENPYLTAFVPITPIDLHDVARFVVWSSHSVETYRRTTHYPIRSSSAPFEIEFATLQLIECRCSPGGG